MLSIRYVDLFVNTYLENNIFSENFTKPVKIHGKNSDMLIVKQMADLCIAISVY
jgi:hypothetical protein